MNKRRRITVLVAALALSLLSFSTASADTSRPECDRSDPSHLCQASVTVFVFVDRVEQGGSGGFYNNGTDLPLPDARITFVMPDGSREQRVTTLTGLLSFPSLDFLSGDEAIIEIEYPALYRDAALLPCPGSPPRRRITGASF